ncbi:MAG: HPr family phosphocarrier protein [Peptococcaceae bacterium]|jgi:phosphocarrier protein|nr:HPr family phosphocarrier protein [Peptococcaceae bacterium]
MFERRAVIQNPSGLHARPASQLTAYCKKLPVKITLLHGETKADPKSIISLLAAGMKRGTEITVQVEGENEDEIGEGLLLFLAQLAE